jgi:non-specific protein-tyrosine kinase
MDLIDYLKPLRRWWWLLIASTAIAFFSSFLATAQEAPRYRAISSLMVGSAINNPNPVGNDFWLGQQLAQTYIEISRRPAVQAATMQALGLPDWLPDYTVRQVPSTLLIEITVIDTDPDRVAAVANQLADQLIRFSPTGDVAGDQERQRFIREQLADLEGQIKGTQAEIVERQAALGDMISARQIADTQTQIAALQGKLNTLQANYTGLLANTTDRAINTIAVVERASADSAAPIPSTRLATIATAAAIGLLLAALAAYLLEYLDDTVKSAEELTRLTSTPSLCSIPVIPEQSRTDAVLSLEQPRSNIVEAYRLLRTAVQFATLKGGSRSLLVTSSSPAEGKTVTAANLAVVFAQAGRRVLLIDADLRRPRQHRLFNLPNQQGLTTLILGYAQEESLQAQHALFETVAYPIEGVANLMLLTSGPLPPNPSELLGSQQMRQLFEQFSQRFDMVIFDTPPLLAVSDALVLSAHVPNMLLVAQAGKTRVGMLRRVTALLRESGIVPIGFVLNRLSRSHDEYQYYYDKQYTSDEDSEEAWQKALQ